MATEQQSNKVQLGCGTLILIALIVLLFSSGNRGSIEKLENEIRGLRSQVEELKSAVDKQTQEIQNLRSNGPKNQ